MKIVNIEKIKSVRHLNLFRADYHDRLGQLCHWHFVSRQEQPKWVQGNIERADAAVIVPIHMPSGKLVVIREFRVPLNDYHYGLPAGLIDVGESTEQAAARELMEETGLRVSVVLGSSPAVFSTAGIADESIIMVYVQCEGQPSNGGNESSEDIEVCMLSPEEARRLCTADLALFDAKAWLVTSEFARHGKLGPL